MNDLAILVKLKAHDPEAMTAISTLRRISPAICPEMLQRFDHWRFESPGNGEATVSAIVAHFNDIVNPNKQIWSFTGRSCSLLESSREMTWVSVLVTDIIDSVSENWSRILQRNRFDVAGVRYSVLWRFGFPSGMDRETAERNAAKIAITTHRDSGLLANPVSQRIEILGPTQD